MKYRIVRALALCAVMFAAVASAVAADLQVASLFADNMVLQRGMKVPVWGFAATGRQVTVQFAGQTVQAVADAGGRWKTELAALQASDQPRELIVTADADKLTIRNVLVGEVWLAGGQSNMELSVSAAADSAREIAAANYPQIREFGVEKTPAISPQETCGGSWRVCSPSSVGGFSAAGYYFARELNQKLHVPVGIIHSSWGGTAAQPWTPLATMQAITSLKSSIQNYQQEVAAADSPQAAQKQSQVWQDYAKTNAQWLATAVADDAGITGKWYEPQAQTTGWETIVLPRDASHPWHFLGTMWIRKQVSIPASWSGKDLVLHLGVVNEADETYVNGQRVGGRWYGDANLADTARACKIPGALVAGDKLVIAIRIMNLYSFGGLTSQRDDLNLQLASDARQQVTVAGEWQFHEGKKLSRYDIPRPTGLPAPMFADVKYPANLYNGMIAPLVPHAIAGAIWYQGESNASQADVYRELFPAMIAAWRAAWGQGDYPFYFVQLANFGPNIQKAPIEKADWPELRDAQLATLALPNTGMAVAIDIGHVSIHPPNKQDVGSRLALWALAKVYGQNIEYSGPLYKSMTVEGAKIRLTFDHADTGLVVKGDTLTGFAVAGADKVFHQAQAQIDGKQILVSNDQVASPVAVRYGWATNPVCNLYNKDMLPASPFRTDDWKRNEVK